MRGEEKQHGERRGGQGRKGRGGGEDGRRQKGGEFEKLSETEEEEGKKGE